MIRTTVYLDEEIAMAIRQLARTQKRSQADIIRNALGKYLNDLERQSGRPPVKGVGVYSSGRSDVSEKAEELIREAARNRR